MSDPMHATARAESDHPQRWTNVLIVFLRVMATLSLVKGLYHWSLVLGVAEGSVSSFEASPTPWQAATVYFAVIDLVAAVGLWLAAAWGGVLWLTAALSMAALEMFFPQVFGGRIWLIAGEIAMIATYFTLAVLANREQPE